MHVCMYVCEAPSPKVEAAQEEPTAGAAAGGGGTGVAGAVLSCYVSSSFFCQHVLAKKKSRKKGPLKRL